MMYTFMSQVAEIQLCIFSSRSMDWIKSNQIMSFTGDLAILLGDVYSIAYTKLIWWSLMNHITSDYNACDLNVQDCFIVISTEHKVAKLTVWDQIHILHCDIMIYVVYDDTLWYMWHYDISPLHVFVNLAIVQNHVESGVEKSNQHTVSYIISKGNWVFWKHWGTHFLKFCQSFQWKWVQAE